MTNTNKDRDGDESKTPTREDVARIIAEAHANIYESDPVAFMEWKLQHPDPEGDAFYGRFAEVVAEHAERLERENAVEAEFTVNEPTTPESILARFAAAYAEHLLCHARRLRITYDNGNYPLGYITVHQRRPGNFLLLTEHGYLKDYIYPRHITRIDYSNARYRGAEPLWQKEEVLQSH